MTLLLQAAATMPDTGYYLWMGLIVIAIIFFGYIASLVVRWRNLEADLHTLEQLSKE